MLDPVLSVRLLVTAGHLRSRVEPGMKAWQRLIRSPWARKETNLTQNRDTAVRLTQWAVEDLGRSRHSYSHGQDHGHGHGRGHGNKFGPNTRNLWPARVTEWASGLMMTVTVTVTVMSSARQACTMTRHMSSFVRRHRDCDTVKSQRIERMERIERAIGYVSNSTSLVLLQDWDQDQIIKLTENKWSKFWLEPHVHRKRDRDLLFSNHRRAASGGALTCKWGIDQVSDDGAENAPSTCLIARSLCMYVWHLTHPWKITLFRHIRYNHDIVKHFRAAPARMQNTATRTHSQRMP